MTRDISCNQLKQITVISTLNQTQNHLTCYQSTQYHMVIIIIIIIIIIYLLNVKIVGAPQLILQPVSSIFPCSPLASWTWRIPGLSIL